jgi:hypothetical protein
MLAYSKWSSATLLHRRSASCLMLTPSPATTTSALRNVFFNNIATVIGP